MIRLALGEAIGLVICASLALLLAWQLLRAATRGEMFALSRISGIYVTSPKTEPLGFYFWVLFYGVLFPIYSAVTVILCGRLASLLGAALLTGRR